MRVLIVDDDRAVRDALRRALMLAGYDIALAEDGDQAMTQVAETVPDAVLLDVGLPGMSGLEVCRALRKAGNRVPILMLTARETIADRIAGLDAGADDYLPKPFDLGELEARVRALMRRAGADGDPDVLALRRAGARRGPPRRAGRRHLRRADAHRVPAARAADANPRRVLPHSLIYDRVWGYDFGPASNGLRVYVGYLRRKLEEAGARPLIHTIRGVGYVLREP